MLDHLLIIWKSDSRVLMHEQLFSPLIFHNRNNHVHFGNKQQVFHELLCIIFLVRSGIPKMIYDCPISNNSPFLGLFLTLILYNKSLINTSPPTLSYWMFIQNMFFHRSGPMVLVVRDQTFPFLVVWHVLCSWETKWHIRQRMVWATTWWGSLLLLITKKC